MRREIGGGNVRGQASWINQYQSYQLLPYLCCIIFITSKKVQEIRMIPANPNPFWNLLFVPPHYDSLPYPFHINFSPEKPIHDHPDLIKKEQPTENDIIQLLPKDMNQGNEQSSQNSYQRSNFKNVSQQKKHFKKDKTCPVRGCTKKYSSRIAMRAHLRKKHPSWAEQTSDYEP